MPASLEWGVGPTGALVFASSMVGVDPRDRPRVTCPECDDVVTFKAGDRGLVTPHVAHRSGSACAATNPETAAHFNAKMLLARVLGPRGTLRLRVRCDFGHTVEADWCAPAWQRAEAEFRVDTRRPDVAVFGEGDAVVGAVEVLHTHRVDRRKASDYAASGVPWVEFRAEHVLAWDGKGALPVEAADVGTLRELLKTCAGCRAMYHPPTGQTPAEDIAGQARRFRATLEKMRIEKERERLASLPPLPSLTEEEKAARRAYYAQHSERMAEVARRERDGDRPRLNVVVAHAIADDYVAVAAVVARSGAVPSAKVLRRCLPDRAEGAWLSAEYAAGLVEERAKRPASLWVAAVNLREANYQIEPGAPDDEEHRLKRRVVDAVARTGSFVFHDVYGAGLGHWFVEAHRACRQALEAHREVA